MAPVVLAYYNYRGFAEPIRYMLHYLDVEFEDKRYEMDDDKGWRQDKYNLGLEFPNIPYYIDGDVKLTQSLAILRYLARKNPDIFYSPKTENELQKFQMVEGHAGDLGMNLAFWAFSPSFEEWRSCMSDKMKELVKMTSKALGKNQWIMGDKISYVDFILFDNLDVVKLAFPDCCSENDNVVKYLERFAKLKGIKEYRAKNKNWPIWGPPAHWGASGDPPSVK